MTELPYKAVIFLEHYLLRKDVYPFENIPRTDTLIQTLQNLKASGVQLFCAIDYELSTPGFLDGLVTPLTYGEERCPSVRHLLRNQPFTPGEVLSIGSAGRHQDTKVQFILVSDSDRLYKDDPKFFELERVLADIFGEPILSKRKTVQPTPREAAVFDLPHPRWSRVRKVLASITPRCFRPKVERVITGTG